MSKTNPNEAAFSKAAFYHPDGGYDAPQVGLTKREYFAALMLQGIVSSGIPQKLHESFAKESIQLADVLIKELNKGGDND